MKRTVTYSYALTRNEVIAAIIAAVGLPSGTVPESFSMTSDALGEPQPVLWLTVVDGEPSGSRP